MNLYHKLKGKLLKYPSFFANLQIYPWSEFKLLKYPYTPVKEL